MTSILTVDDISIDLLEVDGAVTLIAIRTPLGTASLIGELRFQGRTLLIDGVHVEANMRGRLGRRGIDMVLKKLLVEADVERLVIQGGVRTTGRYVGRRPHAVVFPR